MDTPFAIYVACVLFAIADCLWSNYLAWRQYKVYVNTACPPAELCKFWDAKRFIKSRLYMIDKAKFKFVVDTLDQGVLFLVLFFNVIPYAWKMSGSFCDFFNTAGEIKQSVVLVAFFLTANALFSLPFCFYSTFVIEEKHGFNKQTIPFFFKDQLKSFVVSTAITLPTTAALLWVIKAGGNYFVAYVMIFLTLFMLLMMIIYPEFIAPLFDKYTPLPEGDLKTDIEQLAKRVDYPLKQIYVVEGSKRSSHSNAYLYGIWKKKRIVLYDTLLADTRSEDVDLLDDNVEWGSGKSDDKTGLTNVQVVAVVGHELGHWKLWHNAINIIISELSMLLQFSIFGLLYKMPAIYRAFGFYDEMPTIIGMTIIFAFIYAPLNMTFGFLSNVTTRKMEYDADAFSAKLGYSQSLQKALVNLSLDNLSFPSHDWLYSAWHYSHPSLLERINALAKYK